MGQDTMGTDNMGQASIATADMWMDTYVFPLCGFSLSLFCNYT